MNETPTAPAAQAAPTAPAATTASPTFDAAQVQYALGQVRSEQNLTMGILAGAVAALVGAGAWALITIITNFQIGWMAVGVGFLVGFAVQKFGKGVDKAFGIAGAVLALLGCVLGNLLTACGLVAAAQQVSFTSVLAQLTPSTIAALMGATFSPMDLLFYGIAVYEGYKLSFRRITEQELSSRIAGTRTSTAG